MSYIYVNKEDKKANDINLLNEIIQLNEDNEKIEAPTLRLMTRSFRNLGKISHYQNWNISLVGVGLNEISFSVNKYIDGKENPVWNDLVDLKIVNVNNIANFEIQVDYADDAETIKNVHGVSLETELGQIYLHEFHVNDDEAHENITSDFVPTTFYNVNDKEHSLLHRALSEAPHWTLDDENITKFISLSEDEDAELCSRFQRTYTVDSTTILDFFNGEVAEQSNVIFIFDTVNRKIGCKSLIDCYVNGKLMEDGIGKDTTILVSKNKLANSIQISSDKDSVKNCFRIVGGDETINDMVRVANVNGSNKIYLFDKFQLDDMTPELKQKIAEYQTLLDSERNNYYGENGIYTRLIEQYERLSYLESEMMPTIDIEPPENAEVQFNLLKEKLSNIVVGVSSLSNYDANLYTAITNNVEAIANVLIDSRYSLDIVKVPDESPYYICEPDNDKYIWNGLIKVAKVSDKTDFYPKTDEEGNYQESDYISVSIADDTTDPSLPFTRQKIDIALAKGDMSLVDYEATQFGTRDEVYGYFNQYCLNRLKSFVDGYETCVDTLRTGKVESDVKDELLDVYSFRLDIVKQVYDERYLEIYGNDDTKGIVDIIEDIKQEQAEFQDRINFQSFLGEKLYVEFCSYCREETYSNNNFISDGKESFSTILEVAKELVNNAEKELKKACVLQRTVSVPLNNLLALPEFKPFYSSLNLFNYILVQTEDELLKLRLIGIDFSGDSVSDINVTFSDQIISVDREIDDKASIFQQMTTIATNYNSTILQAKQGVEANKELNDIYTNGLNATKAMITNSDDNEVTVTKSGILIRRMDDEGYYGLKQIRTIGNGIYMTEDAWKTVSMAIGEINFNGKDMYGVIAEAIIGEMIVGNNLIIGNDNNVIIDGDGVTIYDGKYTEETAKKVFYADTNGNLNLEAYIYAKGGKIGGLDISENSLRYIINSFYSLPVDANEYNRHYYEETFIVSDSQKGLVRLYLDESVNRFYVSYKYPYLEDDVITWDSDLETNQLCINGYIGDENYVDNYSSTYDTYLYYYNIPYEEGTICYNGQMYYYISESFIAEDPPIMTPIPDGTIYGRYKYILNTQKNCTGNYMYIWTELDFYGDGLLPEGRENYIPPSRLQKMIEEAIKNMMLLLTEDELLGETNVFEINKKSFCMGESFLYNLISDTLLLRNIQNNITPKTDGFCSIGEPSLRWSTVYAKTGAISTSDKNQKKDINYDLDKYIKLFDMLKPCSFRFINGTRIHIGYIAQDVEDAMKQLGITSLEFGGFCKDMLPDGTVVYSLRYDEFEGIYHAKLIQQQEEINTLKEELIEIKKIINTIKEST